MTKLETQSKREQILDAASRCFSRHGFGKTTMDDIAAVLGMKKASLYYYYEGKEAIFGDVINREADRFFDQASSKLAEYHTASERLLQFVKFQLEYYQELVTAHNLTSQVALEFLPVVDKYYRQVRQREIDFVAAIVQKGIESSQFKDCDPGIVALATATIVKAFRYKALLAAEEGSAATVDYSKLLSDVQHVLELFIFGLIKQ